MNTLDQIKARYKKEIQDLYKQSVPLIIKSEEIKDEIERALIIDEIITQAAKDLAAKIMVENRLDLLPKFQETTQAKESSKKVLTDLLTRQKELYSQMSFLEKRITRRSHYLKSIS